MIEKKIPVKYPQSVSEICKLYNSQAKEETLEEVKKKSLYEYLQRVAWLLDRMAGPIQFLSYNNTFPCWKWVVSPSFNVDKIKEKIDDSNYYVRLFFEGKGGLDWQVQSSSTLYAHFGFYRKRAAELFLELLKEDIEEWGDSIYRIDKGYLRKLQEKLT